MMAARAEVTLLQQRCGSGRHRRGRFGRNCRLSSYVGARRTRCAVPPSPRLRRARPASPGYGERGPLRPSLPRAPPTSPRLGRGYGGHGQISPGYGGHQSGPASRPYRERSSVWCGRAILARFARAKTQLRSGLGPWGRTIASRSVFSSLGPGKDRPATPDPRESGRAKSDGVIPRKSSRRRPPVASGSERAKIP
jgi:hypothetical protein